MRPVLGEFGFATSDEQESCFLEDKADSLYRLREIGGRKECNTLHSRKGLSPLSFFGIHRFRPAGVWKAGARRMALVVQWGNWSAERSTDHSYVHSCPKINQTWLDFESSQFFIYDCQGGSRTPPITNWCSYHIRKGGQRDGWWKLGIWRETRHLGHF